MQSVKLMSSMSRGMRLWAVAAVAVLTSLIVPVSAADAAAGTPQGVAAESLGNDTVQVSWDAPTDGPSTPTGYVVEYSTKSTFTPSTTQVYQREDKPLEPVAYVGGLTRNTKYYFRVSAAFGTTKSSPSAVVDATPKYEYGSVDGIKTRNIGTTFIDAEWVFNEDTLGTPGWRIRAENVADRDEAHWNDLGSDSNGKVTGLKKNTTYYVWVASLLPVNGDAPAVRVGPYSKAIKVKTSNYDVSGPSDLLMTKQESTQIELSWKAQAALPAGYKYVVQYGTSTTPSSKDKKAEPTTQTTQTITGLTPNVNYFMRVYVVDGANKQKSDYSDSLQTKTPTARGTITGHVGGIPSAALKDVVVSVYERPSDVKQKGNLAEEGDVKPDGTGNYTMAVRPGNYRIQVAYTGPSNYTTLWARSGSTGGIDWSESTSVPVKENLPATASDVTLGTGGEVSGTVRDTYSVGGEPMPFVDVTARSCSSELVGSRYDRDVMGVAVTDSAGKYTLDGLPDGAYWMRYVYKSGDGFEPAATAVKLKNHKVVSFLEAGESCLTMPDRINGAAIDVKMDLKDYQTEYSIHVYGSRKVGTTLTTKINKWIGSQYGVSATHSPMKWVWTRNGVPISGTKGDTYTNSGLPGTSGTDYCSSIRCTPKYKLTSADRGKYVTLQVTYGTNGTDIDYGYKNSTKTYPKFKVR